MRCDWFIMFHPSVNLFMSLFIADWHSESDVRAHTASPALHPDASAVRFDDAARYGQSHSQPPRPSQTICALGGRAEEFVKDALAQFRRNAAPLVLHRDHYHLILGAARGDFNTRARGGIFRGVVNQ